jgi:hypothetical protein
VLIVGLNTVLNYRLILREEEKLLEEQGERYRAFCAAVPRLWPALRPRLRATNAVTPHWRGAFAGEFMFWLFFAGMVIFAVTENQRITLQVITAGLVVYIVQHFVFRKRPRR